MTYALRSTIRLGLLAAFGLISALPLAPAAPAIPFGRSRNRRYRPLPKPQRRPAQRRGKGSHFAKRATRRGGNRAAY